MAVHVVQCEIRGRYPEKRVAGQGALGCGMAAQVVWSCGMQEILWDAVGYEGCCDIAGWLGSPCMGLGAQRMTKVFSLLFQPIHWEYFCGERDCGQTAEGL